MPVNPTDIGLLFGPADPGQAQAGGSAGQPVITVQVPAAAPPGLRKRIGKSLPVGSEGAGVVNAAGASDSTAGTDWHGAWVAG